jgi:hypothetical protein
MLFVVWSSNDLMHSSGSTMSCFLKSLVLTFSFLSMFSTAWAGTNLIMVEEQGCLWCIRWNEEIAPIYPKTEEGAHAPLRRIDLHDPQPSDLTFKLPVRFTPTFILMDNGIEVGRIEGYPGEDFFWGLLGVLFQRIPIRGATTNIAG